ncbi:MAG: hydroxymethylglutaryl-CoA lyase [Alphaproteobacteria bacterium]|nr:hydroxymethylglutaryl-CoA lyase [Alphaproteobacteria bacterium]
MIAWPAAATVVEVGPRDGLQSFPRWVDTAVKVRMIDRLSDAGFPVIEAVSFASPKFIPNLRDAEEVMARVRKRPGAVYRGLVPNRRGAERAVGTGVDELAGLITASATYTRKNQNMTMDAAVEQAIGAFQVADGAGLGFVMGIGMAMWCPYEGVIAEETVLAIMRRLHEAGVRAFTLAGSMGMEDPRRVGRLFARAANAFPGVALGYHVHNMSGMATANILAALDAGVTMLEGSICGLGGGMATRAVGNLPTEDIVQMLNESGIATGVATDGAIAAAKDVAAMLDVPLQSNAAVYGSRGMVLAASAAGAAAH